MKALASIEIEVELLKSDIRYNLYQFQIRLLQVLEKCTKENNISINNEYLDKRGDILHHIEHNLLDFLMNTKKILKETENDKNSQ
jgi:hypothetical protein